VATPKAESPKREKKHNRKKRIAYPFRRVEQPPKERVKLWREKGTQCAARPFKKGCLIKIERNREKKRTILSYGRKRVSFTREKGKKGAVFYPRGREGLPGNILYPKTEVRDRLLLV